VILARVCAIIRVAVTGPVDPAYVVPRVKAPCAVKFPIVPKVRPDPEIVVITELTGLPVAKSARDPVPLRAY
jgi:hypothetical protein